VSDVEKTIVEALRVTKPGGFVVFVEPNRFHPLQIIHGVSRKAEWGTLLFSVGNIKRLLKVFPEVEDFWILPINTYLYIRRKFPPARLRSFFICLEDMLNFKMFSTHYMIIIRCKKEN
jgi:SAM-dependent methyltransferase